MPHRHFRHCFRGKTLLHRWPAKLVLLGYVWMCCGGTIPASLLMSAATAKSVAEKDRSVPYPCMDKPCGCRNAEQCFKSCCCSTKAERIAWAKQHHVAEHYLTIAEQAEEKPATVKSCCVSKATSLCCDSATKVETKPLSCCARPSPQSKQPSEEPTKERQSSKRNFPGISLLAALRCSGLQVGALGVPLSLPASLELDLPLTAPLIGSVEHDTPIFSSPVDTPDAPPPRAL